jgi:hypothetical protein
VAGAGQQLFQRLRGIAVVVDDQDAGGQDVGGGDHRVLCVGRWTQVVMALVKSR